MYLGQKLLLLKIIESEVKWSSVYSGDGKMKHALDQIFHIFPVKSMIGKILWSVCTLQEISIQVQTKYFTSSVCQDWNGLMEFWTYFVTQSNLLMD